MMKKSLIIALLVANILGVLSPFLSSTTSHAYAQEPTPLTPVEIQQSANIIPVDNNEAAREAARMAAQKEQSRLVTQPETDSACSEITFNPKTWIGGFVCYIIRVTLLKFAIGGLYITSKAFDYAVNLTLFDLNKAMSESSMIYNLWSGVRDFCNIAAIFLFFIALFLSSISDKGVEARKYMVKVIIFAIFLNFSFPIAKGVIDISNVFALNVYGSITQYRFQDNAIQGKVINDFGLSFELMQILGIQDPVAKIGDIQKAPTVIQGVDGVVTILGLVMLVCAMAVVFAQAFMLIATRLAMVLICIVTSPIMFMGGILPPNSPINLDEYVDRWLKTFFGSAFFAPILMIAIGLAIQLMRFAMNLGGGTTGLGSTDSLLKLVLMVVCIIIFQKSIEYSATLMDGIGQRAAALGARMGGKMMSAGIARPAAFLTRNTLGRGVSRVLGQNEEKWLNKVKDGGGLRGRIAGGTLKGLDSIRGLKSVQGFNDSIRNSSMDMMGRGTALMSLGTVNNIRANQGSLIRDDEKIAGWKEQMDANKQSSMARKEIKRAKVLEAKATTHAEDKAKVEQNLIQAESKAIELQNVAADKNLENSTKIEGLEKQIAADRAKIITLEATNDFAGASKLIESTQNKTKERNSLISEIDKLKTKSQEAQDKLKEKEKSLEDHKDQAESLAQVASEQELYAKEKRAAARATQSTVEAAREAYKAKYRTGDDAENAVNSLSLESLAQMSGEIGAVNTASRAEVKAKAEASTKAKYDKEAATQMKAIMAALAKNAAAGGHGAVPVTSTTTPKPTASVPTPKPAPSTPTTPTSTGGH